MIGAARAPWVTLVIFLAGPPACMTAGEVSGKIVEPNGEPASFAEVFLIEPVKGEHHRITAEQDGTYRISNIPGGDWIVVANSATSGATARARTRLPDGATVGFPLTLLAVGPLIEIDDLPSHPLYNGNDLDLLQSASEITRGEEGGNIDGFGPYSPRGNFALNSTGLRSVDNNFLVDGMDNNDPWRRGPVIDPSVDAIRAVRIADVYIPADQGHATGTAINSLSRSGSDAWHGSAFDFLGNSALDARNFFDGPARPGITRNQFGGSLGGPLPGRNWFFFLDSDFLRARDGLTVISTVPTVEQKSGFFGGTPIYDPATIVQTGPTQFTRLPFANNAIPPSSISPQALALVDLYPDPNLPGAADNFRYTPSATSNGERYGIRTDKTLSSRNAFYGRANYERSGDLSPGALPGGGNDLTQHADDANLHLTAFAAAGAWTYAPRASVVNQLRGGMTRLDWSGVPLDSQANPEAALSIPGLLSTGGLPVVSPEGFARLGAAESVPSWTRSTTYELRDALRWTTARHSFEFGVQLMRRHVDGDQTDWTSRSTFLFTPDYTSLPNISGTGDSIASLLLGDPSEVRRDVQFQPYRLRGWELAGYAQDRVRLGAKLMIEGGLRYSLDPPVTEADNRMVNFSYIDRNPALNYFAGQNGINDYAGLSYNKMTLAPRLGMVWDIRGNGSTLLRAAFSKDFDPGAYIAEGVLARNPPYESRLDMFNGSLDPGPTLAAGLPAPAGMMLLNSASLNEAQGSIYAIEPRGYTPYADQWGVFLQQRLRANLVLELAGTSSMGVHLYETYDSNQPFPAPTYYGAARYPFSPYDSRVEYLNFAGGSTYYGGQVKLAGRIVRNLNVLITYRYAKSLDDSLPPETSQDSRPTGAQDIYYLKGQRSPSTFDIPQRVVAAVSYESPFRNKYAARWQLHTLTTVQSGLPFTPQLGTNGLNNGDYQLPNRVGSGALPPGQQSYLNWFNTSVDTPGSAFATPPMFQDGDSGFDILRGSGLATLNCSLGRDFPFKEKIHLLTRVEAADLLNRVNFALPQRILDVESAGVISHTATPAREFTVVARLAW